MRKENKILIISEDDNVFSFLKAQLDSSTYDILFQKFHPEKIQEILNRNFISLLLYESNGEDLTEIQLLHKLLSKKSIPIWVCPTLTKISDQFLENLYELGISDLYIKFSTLEVLKRKIEKHFKNSTRLQGLNLANKHILSLLSRPPDVPSLDIGIKYQPKDVIGGDFYDFFVTDKQSLIIVLGDVTGHGIQAAVIQTMARKVIQMALKSAPTVMEGLKQAHKELYQDLPSGNFVALLVAEWIPSTGSLQFYRLGTPHPILKSKNEVFTLLSNGSVLGLLPEDQFNKTDLLPLVIELDVGDMLLLHTDGLIESVAKDGSLFGMEGLTEVMQKTDIKELAKDIVEEIYNLTESSVGKISDDLTCIVLKRVL